MLLIVHHGENIQNKKCPNYCLIAIILGNETSGKPTEAEYCNQLMDGKDSIPFCVFVFLFLFICCWFFCSFVCFLNLSVCVFESCF